MYSTREQQNTGKQIITVMTHETYVVGYDSHHPVAAALRHAVPVASPQQTGLFLARQEALGEVGIPRTC